MDLVALCPFSVASVAWQPEADAWNVSVCVKATFTLVHGGVARIADEQEPAGDDAYFEGDSRGSLASPSDFVPYKPRADVLFVGSAHAPSGGAATALVARLTVGDFTKALRVVGDRSAPRNGNGARPAAPKPFREMPIRYERAAALGDNIRGRDAAPPNVELVVDADAATPGFGPVAPSWRARILRLGEGAIVWAYRAHVRDEDGALEPLASPPPPGFDFGFFNAAPRDQQIDLLRPGAPIVLEHLHAREPRFETRLPKVRPRVFRADKNPRRPAEVAMRCDTILIDGERGIALVSWRGLTQVPGPDASAWGRFVVALERPEARVRTEAIVRAFGDAPVAPPAPIAPPPPPPKAESTRRAGLPVIGEDEPEYETIAVRKVTSPARLGIGLGGAGVGAPRGVLPTPFVAPPPLATPPSPLPLRAPPLPPAATRARTKTQQLPEAPPVPPPRRSDEFEDTPETAKHVVPKLTTTIETSAQHRPRIGTLVGSDFGPTVALPFRAAREGGPDAPSSAPPMREGLPFSPHRPSESPSARDDGARLSALPFKPPRAPSEPAIGEQDRSSSLPFVRPNESASPRWDDEATQPITIARASKVMPFRPASPPLSAAASSTPKEPSRAPARGDEDIGTIDIRPRDTLNDAEETSRRLPKEPDLVVTPGEGLRLGGPEGGDNDEAPETLVDEGPSPFAPRASEVAEEVFGYRPKDERPPSSAPPKPREAVKKPEFLGAKLFELPKIHDDDEGDAAATRLTNSVPERASETATILREPRAAEPAAFDPATFPIDHAAALAAELALKKTPRAEALARKHVDEATWTRVESHWATAIAKETERGRTQLLGAYDAAYVAGLEQVRGPITTHEYAKLAIGVETGETADALAELGLPAAALMRIERVWTKRLAEDALLGQKVDAAAEAIRRGSG